MKFEDERVSQQTLNTAHLRHSDINTSTIGHVVPRHNDFQSDIKLILISSQVPDEYDLNVHEITISQEIRNPLNLEFHQVIRMHKVIDSLADIKDNWDGEGSKKPTKKTIATAKTLVKEFYIQINSSVFDWINPRIYNEQNGYISIEWQNQGRQIYFDIKDDDIEYTKMWKTIDAEGNTWRDSETDSVNMDSYIDLWKWLING